MKTLLYLIWLILVFPAFANETSLVEDLCNNPDFICRDIVKGESWESLWPDPVQRDLVRRLNRMNTPVKTGMKIAFPKAEKFPTLLCLSPLPLSIPADGTKSVRADMALLAWGAYDETGKLLRWGPLAGGKAWCPDVKRACRTIVGEFEVLSKKGADCRSGKFPIPKGGAPMPYCMFFKGGYALHGSNQVPGYHASHGCVRLFTEDAKWLNENFVEIGTPVKILPYKK